MYIPNSEENMSKGRARVGVERNLVCQQQRYLSRMVVFSTSVGVLLRAD